MFCVLCFVFCVLCFVFLFLFLSLALVLALELEVSSPLSPPVRCSLFAVHVPFSLFIYIFITHPHLHRHTPTLDLRFELQFYFYFIFSCSCTIKIKMEVDASHNPNPSDVWRLSSLSSAWLLAAFLFILWNFGISTLMPRSLLVHTVRPLTYGTLSRYSGIYLGCLKLVPIRTRILINELSYTRSPARSGRQISCHIGGLGLYSAHMLI